MPPQENIIAFCICGDQQCAIPYGFCHCSCGEKTTISVGSDKAKGYIKGLPKMWSSGHYRRNIDWNRSKRAYLGSIGYPAHTKTLEFVAARNCVCGQESCQTPYGLCHCGCGNKTKIANRTHLHINEVARYPRVYCHGHNAATHRHTIDRKPSPTFRIWSAMLARCYKESDKGYVNYGGRGIKVCDRWRNDFESFYCDMGPRPDEMSLDRIDNDGNYFPENCRWATRIEQARNKRNNRAIMWGGRVITLKEFSEVTGVSNTTLLMRLRRGMTPQQAAITKKYGRIKPGE